MLVPQSRNYESHGLRLNYADWGNEDAPVVILVHGGRDHGRSWDVIAKSLQPQFHVIAPDLRGHGDSDWAKGSSYALTEYVYDLTQLIHTLAVPEVTLIGHSMGGMVSLIYAGSYPEHVSKLVALDGVTVLPDAPKAPPHERITKWIGQLDRLHDRAPRRYRTIEDAAAQMISYNKRLSRELALHLATYGTRQNVDGSYSWKFDPYQRVNAPHRLWSDDHVALWARITCPTLLLNAGESFLSAPKRVGLDRYFQQARIETIAGAGHWLHHDRPAEVLSAIREFLGLVADP